MNLYCSLHTSPISSPFIAAAGKSLSVHEVARRFTRTGAAAGQPVVISLNCMSLRQPRTVYKRILDGLIQSRNTGAHKNDSDPILYPGAYPAIHDIGDGNLQSSWGWSPTCGAAHEALHLHIAQPRKVPT